MQLSSCRKNIIIVSLTFVLLSNIFVIGWLAHGLCTPNAAVFPPPRPTYQCVAKTGLITSIFLFMVVFIFISLIQKMFAYFKNRNNFLSTTG